MHAGNCLPHILIQTLNSLGIFVPGGCHGHLDKKYINQSVNGPCTKTSIILEPI